MGVVGSTTCGATFSHSISTAERKNSVGSAAVTGAPDRVTLTACDQGSATTPIPNRPNLSMAFLANRDGFYSLFLGNGDTTELASCTADTIVRDPVFAPVIEAAGNDPTAEPDPALVATVGARLREVHAQCQQA